MKGTTVTQTISTYMRRRQAYEEEIAALRNLVREARRLILAMGESMDVPVQFDQHGWLREADSLLPKRPSRKL